MPKSRSELNNTQITPKPSLEKRTRRKFPADYTLCTIAEADACHHDEIGALRCREHLNSNQLSNWRREYAEHGVAGLAKSAPGPTPSKTPDQRRVEQSEKDNNRLARKLEIANDRLDLRKKALALLDLMRNGNNV